LKIEYMRAYMCVCMCMREKECVWGGRGERRRERKSIEGRRDVKFSNEFMRVRIDTIVILFSSGKKNMHLM